MSIYTIIVARFKRFNINKTIAVPNGPPYLISVSLNGTKNEENVAFNLLLVFFKRSITVAYVH